MRHVVLAVIFLGAAVVKAPAQDERRVPCFGGSPAGTVQLQFAPPKHAAWTESLLVSFVLDLLLHVRPVAMQDTPTCRFAWIRCRPWMDEGK
jgi:hypothetical protein